MAGGGGGLRAFSTRVNEGPASAGTEPRSASGLAAEDLLQPAEEARGTEVEQSCSRICKSGGIP